MTKTVHLTVDTDVPEYPWDQDTLDGSDSTFLHGPIVRPRMDDYRRSPPIFLQVDLESIPASKNDGLSAQSANISLVHTH